MKSKVIPVLLTMVLIIGVFAGITLYNDRGTADEEVVQKDVYIDVYTPKKGSISLSSDFIGKIEPGQQVNVFPKLPGEVITANFNVGDHVEAGDVLCEINADALRSSISQMQAALGSAAAKAQHGLDVAQQSKETYENSLENGTNTNLIAAQAALKTAKSALDSASVAARSARKAWHDANSDGPRDFYTEAQLDQFRDATVQADLAEERAKFAVEQAQDTLDAVKAAIEDGAASIDNSIKMAELNTNMSDQYIALRKLQDDLSNATVTAPISGIIEQKNVEPFGIASQQAPAYVISDKNSMVVSFSVPESVRGNMEIGGTVNVEKSGQFYDGNITEISTMVNPANGLFLVKATVEDSAALLLTGSTVIVSTDINKAGDAVLLPISNIYYRNNEAYVYVLEDGFAKIQSIETGIVNEEYAEILSGVSTGMSVISSWSPELRDGAPVKIAE